MSDLIFSFLGRFIWGKWHDIKAGNFNSQSYVLQGRRSLNGKLQFRVVKSDPHYLTDDKLTLDDLKQLE